MEDLELETSVCGPVVGVGYWNMKIETRMADKYGNVGLDLSMMSCLDKRLYRVLKILPVSYTHLRAHETDS